MIETVEIELIAVQALDIHGSRYFDLRYHRLGSEQVEHMRINPEAFYADPQPGDRVSVNLVMGNIMGATRLAS